MVGANGAGLRFKNVEISRTPGNQNEREKEKQYWSPGGQGGVI